MTSKGHALSRDALIRTLTAYSGITTADGAEGGTTLVDANLKNNPFISPSGIPEKTILILSGDARGEDKGSESFNNDTGAITLQGTGFSAQIKAGTIYRILNISTIEIEVANMDAKIGTAADNADLGTLFGRHKRGYLGTHTHALVVVHDAASLNANWDTALKDWLEDIGFIVTICDKADVNADLELNAFDVIAVSASCLTADAGLLANLKEAEVPVICFSAEIAVSAVFNMGVTAGSQAAQTQIEITNNSPHWLIDQALGNLTVTTAAAIYTMAARATNAIEFGQAAIGVSNDLTMVKLPQGEQDGGTPTYTPFFDRYFIGVGNFTNMDAAFKAILDDLFMHCIMEKRFEEGIVQLKRVYQEQIPNVDFDLTAIDTALTTDPPSADAANSIVDLDQRVNLTYVLRSLWVNVTDFGDGATMTFQLWVLLNGTVTSVDSVVVSSTGIQNLMDIFGLQEVHADGIWITAIVDVGSTGACSGTYRYAEARK